MKALLLAFALSRTADASTTLYAFKYGAQEANPVLSQQPALFTLQVAGGTVVESYGLVWMNRRKPKLAKILGWSLVGVSTAAAVHNWQVGKR